MNEKDPLLYKTPLEIFRLNKQIARPRPDKIKTPSLIEVISEKNLNEADILSRTVEVDNGSIKNVYSEFIFENVRGYNCNVCVTAVFGKHMLFQHHSSKKHYRMVQRFTHPHENFNDEGILPLIKISLNECYLKELIEQCTDENLIGLEYLVEVIEPTTARYVCLLCDKSTQCVINLFRHLQGPQHRLLYLLLFFPKVYIKLILMKKFYRNRELETVTRKIEKQFGRMKPWRHDGKLSLKEKRLIRIAIDKGRHLNDSVDKMKFESNLEEQIGLNKESRNFKFDNTVFTEFLLSEKESSINKDMYFRSKGRDTCRLCNVKLGGSLVEKIVHPFTGEHLAEALGSKSMLDSVDCVIQKTLDNFSQPLIGTEYLIEYIEERSEVIKHFCSLCRKSMGNFEMVLSHFVSNKHRQLYIRHHMPRKDAQLLTLTGPERDIAFTELFKLIEAKLGRFQPYGTVHDLDRQIGLQTVKDILSERIINGNHVGLDDNDRPITIKGMPAQRFSEPTKAEKKKGFKSSYSKEPKSSIRRSRSRSQGRRGLRSQSRSTSRSPKRRRRGLRSESRSTSRSPKRRGLRSKSRSPTRRRRSRSGSRNMRPKSRSMSPARITRSEVKEEPLVRPVPTARLIEPLHSPYNRADPTQRPLYEKADSLPHPDTYTPLDRADTPLRPVTNQPQSPVFHWPPATQTSETVPPSYDRAPTPPRSCLVSSDGRSEACTPLLMVQQPSLQRGYDVSAYSENTPLRTAPPLQMLFQDTYTPLDRADTPFRPVRNQPQPPACRWPPATQTSETLPLSYDRAPTPPRSSLVPSFLNQPISEGERFVERALTPPLSNNPPVAEMVQSVEQWLGRCSINPVEEFAAFFDRFDVNKALNSYTTSSHICVLAFEDGPDKAFKDLREVMAVSWLNGNVCEKLGLPAEELRANQAILKNFLSVLLNTPLPVNPCQPICINLVDKLMESVCLNQDSAGFSQNQLSFCVEGLIYLTIVRYFQANLKQIIGPQ